MLLAQRLSGMVQGITNTTSPKLIGPWRAEKEHFHLGSLGSCFNQLLEGDQTYCYEHCSRSNISLGSTHSDWHITCSLKTRRNMEKNHKLLGGKKNHTCYLNQRVKNRLRTENRAASQSQDRAF